MKSPISSDFTVKELLDRHSRLSQSFIDLGLLCPGCPTEAFHTLKDVAREYGLDLDQLCLCLQKGLEKDTVEKSRRRTLKGDDEFDAR